MLRPASLRLASLRCALGEVRPAEVRPAEVRPAEVRLAEVRLAEVRLAEVRLAEVGSTKIGMISQCRRRHLFHASTPCFRMSRCSGFAIAHVSICSHSTSDKAHCHAWKAMSIRGSYRHKGEQVLIAFEMSVTTDTVLSTRVKVNAVPAEQRRAFCCVFSPLSLVKTA